MYTTVVKIPSQRRHAMLEANCASACKYNTSQAHIIINLIAMCLAPKTRNRLPATHVNLQVQWRVNFFILDLRRGCASVNKGCDVRI